MPCSLYSFIVWMNLLSHKTLLDWVYRTFCAYIVTPSFSLSFKKSFPVIFLPLSPISSPFSSGTCQPRSRLPHSPDWREVDSRRLVLMMDSRSCTILRSPDQVRNQFYTSFSRRVSVPILSKQFVCFLSCSAHGNRPANTRFVSPSLPPSVSEY